MKKLLWIGSFLDEKTNQILISQGYRNAASYVSQKNLLEGIEAETGLCFDSVGAVSMTGYPKQGKIMLKSYYLQERKSWNLLVGYLNLLYLNKYFMTKAMIRGIKKWIKMQYNEGEELDVFIYEMRSACLEAAFYLKKKIPDARIHLIIPDLPCFMDLNMSKIKKCLKQIDWHQMIKRFSCVDDFVLYSETMTEYLDIREKKWMIAEGSINKREVDKIINEMDKALLKKQETNKKIVMYSGWIDRKFGIDELVNAMDYLDDSYELWITGEGTYSEQLKEKIKDNKKIIYYGFLSTREELFKLQAQASVMVNMRDVRMKAAHYCFPSKLFEYMLLGIPVLSVKLRGIPQEYEKYLFEIPEMKAKSIAKAIENTILDEKKCEKAMAGRNFIRNNKNNYEVAKKIIEFIEEKEC